MRIPKPPGILASRIPHDRCTAAFGKDADSFCHFWSGIPWGWPDFLRKFFRNLRGVGESPKFPEKCGLGGEMATLVWARTAPGRSDGPQFHWKMTCVAQNRSNSAKQEVDATFHCLLPRKRTKSDQILTGEQSESRNNLQPDVLLCCRAKERKESCDKTQRKSGQPQARPGAVALARCRSPRTCGAACRCVP